MKRIISVGVVMMALAAVWQCARSAETDISSATEVSDTNMEAQNNMEQSHVTEASGIDMETQNMIEKYYGTYQIKEFWSVVYYGHYKYDVLTDQEADMMLGHIVTLQEDVFETYECYRKLGKAYNEDFFSGNYTIEEVLIENPDYEWETLAPSSEWYLECFGYAEILEKYSEKIAGKIRIPIAEPWGWGEQEYFVMGDSMIMYATLSGQFFYLEKVEEEAAQEIADRQLSAEEETAILKTAILQEIYGDYSVTEFLPTKFYPALDSGGDVLLPQEEADLMIGKEIAVEKELFVTYDNGRLPNSEIRGRSMEKALLETVEIPNPDYRLEVKARDDIYGLRDDMLPEDMVQDAYIEIRVFPGFAASGMDDVLPLLYLVDDRRLILYAMGEYFLLEKESK